MSADDHPMVFHVRVAGRPAPLPTALQYHVATAIVLVSALPVAFLTRSATTALPHLLAISLAAVAGLACAPYCRWLAARVTFSEATPIPSSAVLRLATVAPVALTVIVAAALTL